MFRSGNGGYDEPPMGGSGTGAQAQSFPPHTRLIVRAAIAAGALLVLFIVINFLQAIYTDWLWFSNLEQGEVFTTVLATRSILFLLGFAVSAVVVALSFRVVLRNSWGPAVLPFSPNAVVWLRRALLAGIVFLTGMIAFGFGSALAGRWESVLLALNSVSFDMRDPQFGMDARFYVFTMPILHLAQGWLLGLTIVVLVTSAGLYMLVFSVRGINPILTPAMRTHLAIVLAALMVTIAAAHFLNTYETLFSTGGAVTGTTHADVAARIPALHLLTAIALVSAAIMLFAIRVSSLRQSLRLIVAAFGLWIMVGLLAGMAWPALVQRFAVDPSALERERPYIAHNIEWTRYGYALNNIRVEPYDARDDVLARDISENTDTINNIRLWDPVPLRDVYNQLQHLRLYYHFFDVDVDRYMINGEYRQVLIGAREIFQYGLDDSAQNWVNRRLVYTHGYGAVMSAATGFTGSGQPRFFLRDVPPIGDLELTEPRIYFGQGFGREATQVFASPQRLGPVTEDVVIVNTTEPQFDRPAGGADGQPVYIERYEGSGGITLSNFFRRVLYTWSFADINILLNRQITSESEIMYRRNVQERIGTVAPFLALDRDPYLVIHDGRLFWIQDAYTVTDRLPYSERQAFAAVPGRSPQQFNFIRNSVKVAMDAYNGSLDFYTVEPHGPDPLIEAYRNIFPSLFTPIEQMPEGLRNHIRYPEEFFQAQANAYRNYHMTDPREFFQREDQWAIATEMIGAPPNENVRSVRPYYAIMRLPGQEEQEFVLILPFTPSERQNLVAWMGARSDGDNYGEVVVYKFPSDRVFTGPRQIEARIDNDPDISEQFALWDRAGSAVVKGNLLAIPLGESLLYAKPIYLQADTLAFPELRRVILATHEHVVMEPSLSAAVTALLARQGETPIAPIDPDEPTDPGVVDGIPPGELRRMLDDLESALESFVGGAEELTRILQALRDLAGVPTDDN